MSDFHYLHFAGVPTLATALAPDDPELTGLLRRAGSISDWRVLTLELGPGKEVDYLANSFAFRLCSQRLQAAIDQSRSPVDVLNWLPCRVVRRDRSVVAYSILHFPEVPDVLDHDKSIHSGPVLVKAVLNKQLAERHHVFGFPRDSLRLIVNEALRTTIENMGLTGMTFSKVAAV